MEKWNIASWCVIFLCAVMVFTYAGRAERDMEALQRGIADSIIRFHVRANSDSSEDQELKLLVKEAVVDYMGELLAGVESIEEARKILTDNIENIENVAKGVITEQKKEYNVKAYFENSYFPVKTYGDMSFPAGIYEAFRVDIGAAEGKNWWCVVYPGLCFVDVSYGVVPEESKEELARVLDEDEFALVNGSGYVYGSQRKLAKENASDEDISYSYEFRILRFLNRLFE